MIESSTMNVLTSKHDGYLTENELTDLVVSLKPNRHFHSYSLGSRCCIGVHGPVELVVITT